MQIESQRERAEQKLKRYFPPQQAEVLADVITDAYNGLVKTSDFNELKAIVAQLAQAQQRTELRMEELAQAQQRTEQRMDSLAMRMEELAQAQQRTEQRMDELAQEMKVVARSLAQVQADVGGLSRSVGYALENEAYRMLPAFLLREHNLELIDRLIRTEIAGEEINLFGRAQRSGQEVLIVGETKLQLDERRSNRREEDAVLAQLARKVEVVRQSNPGLEVVPLLITHFARPSFVRRAAEQGIIVVQSFEW
ncbi:MAG: hypothetical protein RMN25_05015 [Anaerolineae bacterium]|nr:hypothetical protein [Thermoflexales bacterium]MDW8407125.1 hypothetical protein [Anaerolineae bacterium]